MLQSNLCALLSRRKLKPETLKQATEAKSLGDFPTGTLFEIMSWTKHSGEFGEYAMAQFATTVNGNRMKGKLRVSQNVLLNDLPPSPLLMLYQGLKKTKNNRSCHAVASYAMPNVSGPEELKSRAEDLRKLTPLQIEAAVGRQSLDQFPENTVFVYKNVTKKVMRQGQDELLMVNYVTKIEGKDLSGVLVLPKRLEGQLQQIETGILLYAGMKQNKEGMSYHDVSVLDEATSAAILQSE